MKQMGTTDITDVIGKLPYRIAFAGGWIDQPFVSKHNPTPPGSMVVVGLQPTMRFMNRCGMGTSTRKLASQIWNGSIPDRAPDELIRELYSAENNAKEDPSGSQDMAGLVYPGVIRLDYDFHYAGGYFPVYIESNNDTVVTQWLERVLHVVPIAQRPPGYNPLGEQNLNPEWISRLGHTGKDCFNAILEKDAQALGASFNECMLCWQAILPHTVRHPTITIDLMKNLEYFQSRYDGAMYSGCGGGYLFVVSEEKVPGAFNVTVRIAD